MSWPGKESPTTETSGLPHIDKEADGEHVHTAHPHEIEEAENLLESYLMRVKASFAVAAMLAPISVMLLQVLHVLLLLSMI